MNKKNVTIIISVLVIIAGGFWIWKNNQGVEVSQQQNQVENQEQNQDKKQEFVVDVDPNVDNWQTRETEFFTVKFPKEWYWLESVITNNPDFDIIKHAGIGIFSDIGPNSPLILSNANEVVITHRGKATSDAGTPQDSINSIFKLAKSNNPSVDCSVSNNKTIPFTAFCSAMYDSQLQQSYYIVNNEISLTLTARTTTDTLVKKEILDKIVGSIMLK